MHHDLVRDRDAYGNASQRGMRRLFQLRIEKGRVASSDLMVDDQEL
jgi:hypothetical protein